MIARVQLLSLGCYVMNDIKVLRVKVVLYWTLKRTCIDKMSLRWTTRKSCKHVSSCSMPSKYRVSSWASTNGGITVRLFNYLSMNKYETIMCTIECSAAEFM